MSSFYRRGVKDLVLLLTVSGFALSVRLGLGIFLQMRAKKRHLFLIILVYLMIGFCLGEVSESVASQNWLPWFSRGEKLIFFQIIEIFLSFIMIRNSFSFLSAEDARAEEGRVKYCLRLFFLLAPSPMVCFWLVFAGKMIKTEFPILQGGEVGMVVLSGLFVLFALLIRGLGRLAVFLPDASLVGFIFSHILVAALAILLPARLSQTPIERGDFNFPGETTLLVFETILMIVVFGFILPYIGRTFTKRSRT